MKKEKSRKLKGSVLLTVVFVMAILIVFLFGTMSLAISANNRSHVNYSSAQTSVTARAVAEAAVKAIQDGSTAGTKYANAIANLNNGRSMTVKIDIAANPDSNLALGRVNEVEIAHVGEVDYYDENNGWEKRRVLKFTASVEMSGVVSNSSVYVVQYKASDKRGGAGGGAGFVTTAGAALTTQTNIFGGAHINLPTLDDAKLYNYGDVYETRRDSRSFVKDGDRYLELYNENGYIEADAYINNDLRLENWRGFVFPDIGKGVTVLGDMYFNNTNAIDHLRYEMEESNLPSGDIEFSKVPYLYVDGKISSGEGIIAIGGIGDRNNPERPFPMNTFCGFITTLKDDGSAKSPAPVYNDAGLISNVTEHGMTIASNLYCMDPDETSYIARTGGSSALINFAHSTINMTSPIVEDEINGEICSRGNLVLQNVTINGDVRVEKTLTVRGDVVVTGKVIAREFVAEDGGRLLAQGGLITGDDIEGSGGRITLQIPNKVGYFYAAEPQTAGVENENGEIEVKYVDLLGHPLTDHYFDNGVKRDENAEVPRIFYTMTHNSHPFLEGMNDEMAKNHVNILMGDTLVFETDYFYEGSEELAKYQISEEKAVEALSRDYGIGVAGDVYGFYYETTPTDIRASESGGDNYESIISNGVEYFFTRGVNYGHKLAPTEEYVEANVVTDGEAFIYPPYAERSAILGLDTSIHGTKAKIVKTLQEVLETPGYNPHDITPPGHTVGTAIARDNIQIYRADNNPSAGEGFRFMNGDASYVTYTADGTGDAQAYYIDSSCTLGDITFDKNVIIKADENEEINIVVNGTVNFEAGKHILVANTGKVNFIIQSEKTLKFSGNILATQSYWNLFEPKAGQPPCSLKFNSDCTASAGHTDVAGLIPNVYVYGNADSNLEIENMKTMTMYVKSPEIKATIKAGDAKEISSFYYNERQMVVGDIDQFMIGCFNVEEVDCPNQINIIYIPEAGAEEEETADEANNNVYKTYYYSEF